jgi:hypothetical protein
MTIVRNRETGEVLCFASGRQGSRVDYLRTITTHADLLAEHVAKLLLFARSADHTPVAWRKSIYKAVTAMVKTWMGAARRKAPGEDVQDVFDEVGLQSVQGLEGLLLVELASNTDMDSPYHGKGRPVLHRLATSALPHIQLLVTYLVDRVVAPVEDFQPGDVWEHVNDLLSDARLEDLSKTVLDQP